MNSELLSHKWEGKRKKLLCFPCLYTQPWHLLWHCWVTKDGLDEPFELLLNLPLVSTGPGVCLPDASTELNEAWLLILALLQNNMWVWRRCWNTVLLFFTLQLTYHTNLSKYWRNERGQIWHWFLKELWKVLG